MKLYFIGFLSWCARNYKLARVFCFLLFCMAFTCGFISLIVGYIPLFVVATALLVLGFLSHDFISRVDSIVLTSFDKFDPILVWQVFLKHKTVMEKNYDKYRYFSPEFTSEIRAYCFSELGRKLSPDQEESEKAFFLKQEPSDS